MQSNFTLFLLPLTTLRIVFTYMVMTSGSPAHPSALQTVGEGKGKLLARGETHFFWRSTYPQRRAWHHYHFNVSSIYKHWLIILILPFLKLLIGIVAHIAILHLCVPILASFYEKNLYLKSVAGITIRKMKEMLSIPDNEVQCNLLLCIWCISCQSKNNWCGH